MRSPLLTVTLKGTKKHGISQVIHLSVNGWVDSLNEINEKWWAIYIYFLLCKTLPAFRDLYSCILFANIIVNAKL